MPAGRDGMTGVSDLEALAVAIHARGVAMRPDPPAGFWAQVQDGAPLRRRLAEIKRMVFFAAAGVPAATVPRGTETAAFGAHPRKADGRRWQRYFAPEEEAALLLWDALGALPCEMAVWLDRGRGALRSKLHRLKRAAAAARGQG